MESTAPLFQSLQSTKAKRRPKERESFHLVGSFGNSPFVFLETQNNPQEEPCHSARMVLGQTVLHWGLRNGLGAEGTGH